MSSIGSEGASFPNTPTQWGTAAFNTWRNPAGHKGTIVVVWAQAQTNGTTNGRISLMVDFTSDGTTDSEIRITLAHNNGGSGYNTHGSATAYVPADGQYQIANQEDPTGNNGIGEVWEIELN